MPPWSGRIEVPALRTSFHLTWNLNFESLDEQRIYFWPTLRTDEVLIFAAEQGSRGNFHADGALKLFFLGLNLVVDELDQLFLLGLNLIVDELHQAQSL